MSRPYACSLLVFKYKTAVNLLAPRTRVGMTGIPTGSDFQGNVLTDVLALEGCNTAFNALKPCRVISMQEEWVHLQHTKE